MKTKKRRAQCVVRSEMNYYFIINFPFAAHHALRTSLPGGQYGIRN